MLKLIALVPLLPLLGVAVNGLWGARMSRRAVGLVACGVVLGSFLLSAGAVWELAKLPPGERHAEVSLGTWLPLGEAAGVLHPLRIDWGFALDPISAVMILVVGGVGSLIPV